MTLARRETRAGDTLWMVGEERAAIPRWSRVDQDVVGPYPKRVIAAKAILRNDRRDKFMVISSLLRGQVAAIPEGVRTRERYEHLLHVVA